MKRFWLVMLSLGLVLAFSASAMAVDVKFSGSFYAAGMYMDKTNFVKDAPGSEGISTAFYYQRLRVGTEFIVSPGLKLVTRFDAMERVWGAARSNVPLVTSYDSGSSGTRAENENIAFDVAYVQWTSPIGMIFAGYLPDGKWGTEFGDSSGTLSKVQFATQVGNATMSIYAGKSQDNSNTAINSTNLTDSDVDKYVATVSYQFNKDISAGLLGAFYNIKAFKGANAMLGDTNPLVLPVIVKAYGINPYAKAKIGPVSLEGELLYVFGSLSFEDGWVGPVNPLHPLYALSDKSLSMLNAYIGAMADFGVAYVGANFAYMSGDDPATNDKWEGGQVGGGWDWNPTLIMFNFDRSYWAGSLGGYSESNMDSGSGLLGARGMYNAWFAQGIVGGRPIPALDIRASLAWASADKKPSAAWVNSTYGYELDVTGTYKITNNLSYMLGVGYLFTGDYFKGTDANNAVKDNYLLINKLTLTF